VDALRLEFGGAEACLAALRAAQGAITGELQKLEGEARSLSGSWSGDAEVAYQSAQRQWSSTMIDMNATLDAAAELLDSWIQGMQQLESDLSTGWPG
jgi:WXG100 family type VII secretion target